MMRSDPIGAHFLSFVTNRMKLAIEWAHCDPAGIVFNPRFFEFFDTGTWHLFETALGVPKQQLTKTYKIWGIPLVDAGADFRIPLAFGEDAEMESTVSEFRRSSFDVVHRILKGDKVAIEGKETRVWTGKDPANPERIRATPIPDEVIAKFKRA